jgi:hypothetical protein
VTSSLEAAEVVFQIYDQRGKGLRIDANRETDLVCAEVEKIAKRVLHNEPLVPPPVEEEEEVHEVSPEQT